MWKKRALTPAGLAVGLTLAWSGVGSAAEAPDAVVGLATLQWADHPLAEAAPAQPQAATDEDLDALSGRGESVAVALTDQNLSAVNTGNTISASTVASGAISLQDSAFSAFSGIGNIMMNTGHNNNLQSTMSVTIIVTP